MSSQNLRDDEDGEEELLKLLEEVETMAQKLDEYRTTLPDQLSSTISSLLASQRPVLPAHISHQGQETDEAGPSKGFMKLVESDTMPLAITEEPEEAEKILLLKQKIASNASTVPVVLKRMKEYMVRIDKLRSTNGVIHPLFKSRGPVDKFLNVQ